MTIIRQPIISVFNRRRPYSHPTDFSNLGLWLESDMGITLNGSDVSAWADQSGNSRHYTQVTALNQFDFLDPDPANGQPALTSPGASQRQLKRSNMSLYRNISGFTVYVVAKATAAATDDQFYWISKGTAAGSGKFSVGVDASGNVNMGAARLDSESANTLTSSTLATTYKLITGVVNFTTGRGDIYVNGVLVATNAALVSTGLTDNTNAIDSAIGTTTLAKGIQAIVGLQAAHSAAEVGDLANYFLSKYRL